MLNLRKVANTGIILSGTGSKREFVQRLGRLLRPKDDRENVADELKLFHQIQVRHLLAIKETRGLRKKIGIRDQNKNGCFTNAYAQAHIIAHYCTPVFFKIAQWHPG